MITLYDKQTDHKIGEISEGELQFLIDEMEEEDSHDKDYYIDASTIDYLVSRKATAHLVALLRKGLGESEGFDARWEDDSGDESD